MAQPVFWLNAALNRVSWRTRDSTDFLVKLLSVEGYHCYLPVKQNLVATCSSKPYINGYVLFAQNFIAICRLYKSSWLSALWGRGFIAIYLSMDDSWSSSCQKWDFMVSYFSILNQFTGCPQPVERPLPRCIGARTRFCGSLPRCASRRATVLEINNVDDAFVSH